MQYGDQTPHRLVATLESRISALESAFHRAYWDSQVEATPENEERRAELELELRRAKGDSQALHAVTNALGTELHDPVMQRQLEVLRLSLMGNQMDEEQRAQIVELSSSVESDFASYRPQLGTREVSENDIEEILRSSDDVEERRAAWEASKEIGGIVADRVRELARLRNEVAHNLGFADYYRMSLALQELDEDWLFEVLGQLETVTEEPFSRWKAGVDEQIRRRFGVTELFPWHYADPFFQSLPPEARITLDPLLEGSSAAELSQRTFANLGIDISRVLASSDLYPRENKCQHAFCLDVDRSGRDVRILANVVPGERWTEVMLHESGHAAYDISIDTRLPYLLRRAAHTFVTEAIALLSGRLVRDADWLAHTAEVDPDKLGGLAADLPRVNAAQSLMFARWCLVMIHFERELYSDPESDLDVRWWELVSRFQLVSAPADRAAPDWAAKIHVATAPVYYQNYLLGDLLASQLKATIDRDHGRVATPAATGELLVDRVFRPGSLLRWDALIEEATGRPLEVDDLATELANV